jgi:hypothetical protein
MLLSSLLFLVESDIIWPGTLGLERSGCAQDLSTGCLCALRSRRQAHRGDHWLYNLAWLVVMDLLKLVPYCLFDLRETGEKRWQQWLYKPLHAYAGLHCR